MIFSELYGAYYNAVAAILSDIAVKSMANTKEMQSIISKHAFAESFLTIESAIKEERWQLISKNGTSPIKHIPSMPLTLLQRRWLKAILEDPRVKLFDIHAEGLEGIDPLFTYEDYLIYDKYSDGDDYTDEGYINRFRIILSALNERKPLSVEIINSKGDTFYAKVMPEKLEYSIKDDKFRLITSGDRFIRTVNLGRIVSCEEYTGRFYDRGSASNRKMKSVTFELTNERNALERVMLHFSHFEKSAKRIDTKHYKVTLKYSTQDETELVIRVLSFGPLIKVTEPEDFRKLIIERLIRQKNCGL